MAQPVLLVEDDVETRESLRFMLESDGYGVVTAGNGQEALDALRQGLTPCLILLDLMMPVMDGFQFRQRQLEDPHLAAIPVVACSGHFDSDANATRLRAAAYFQKPVDVDRLLQIVGSYCDRR